MKTAIDNEININHFDFILTINLQPTPGQNFNISNTVIRAPPDLLTGMLLMDWKSID